MVVAAAQGSVAAWAGVSGSGSASDGGNTVSVGASSSSVAPVVVKGQPVPGDGAGSSNPCTYIPLPAQYANTLGPGGSGPGVWYLVKCPGRTLTIYNGALIWVPTAAPAAPAASGVGADVLAERAVRSLDLPTPEINLNPEPYSIVNLPTWLWVSDAIWHPFVATAGAGGVQVTATAIPTTVTWSMGDGHTVVCDGPGTPYLADVPPSEQSTNCSYTYRSSSAGQSETAAGPDASAFVLKATTNWRVSWSVVGAAGGGALPPLTTSTTTQVMVEQIESIGADG